MSLCFLDAFNAKLTHCITEDEYVRHLLAHFRGVRHPQDDGTDWLAESSDPVGASIRELALSTDYEPMKDTETYEDLFSSCIRGDVDQVKLNLKQMVEENSPRIPLQPLATLAAYKGHAKILRLCLDEGAIFDRYLDRATAHGVVYSDRDPTMLDTLWAVNWRDMQHSQKALDELVVRSVARSDDTMLNWLLDHGAQINSDAIMTVSLPGRHLSTLSICMAKCGITSFKGWGGLQYAAGRGDLELVKFWLNAGADLEEMPKQLDIREPGPFTALYQAVLGQHMEMIKFLLECGAKVDTPCGTSKDNPLELARRLGNREILDLLE